MKIIPQATRFVKRVRNPVHRIRSREDSDSKRHADQELNALQIQILEKRRSDSAQAHSDPDTGHYEHEWMKVRNGCKSILHLGPRAFWKPGNGTDGKK